MRFLPSDAPRDDIVGALYEHWVGHARWRSSLRGDRFIDEHGVPIVVSGLPVAWTNSVMADRLDPSSADQRIEEATDIFRSFGVPAMWWLGPNSAPADLDARLIAHGWEFEEEMPWMAARAEAVTTPWPPPAGLSIERVRDGDGQAAWLHAMDVGFENLPVQSNNLRTLADRAGFDRAGPWVRFAGRLDGRPVASSGLLLFGGLAGVYNVATLPTERGRGIGGAMTAAAVDYARGLGAGIAVLGSSPRGKGLYERMGFREVTRVRSYRWEPPASAVSR